MAFANAFLGVCHSCAHKLGAAWHVPHGLANAAMISHVIAYNATDSPFKLGTFSQARARWQLASVCGSRHHSPCPSFPSFLPPLRPPLQYTFPHAKAAYAEISDFLGFSAPGDSEERKVIRLIEEVEALKALLDIPPTLREIIGADKEAAYLAGLDKLAEDAFDDQCTGANPRYPLISDLRAMLHSAWDKPILPLAELPGVYHPAERESRCPS